jgi:N-sulfoglucosamine sulfohydrolase
MNSNYFLIFLCSLGFFIKASLHAEEKPLNLLLITVDDMSCDSVGVYGCELEGTTPVMDRLASQSLRFDYAHVTVGNCNPCRNVMFSGLISHNNKVEGFYKVTDPGWPHMVDLLKDAGYYAGIRGKVTHSSPYQPYDWDEDLTSFGGWFQGPHQRCQVLW